MFFIHPTLPESDKVRPEQEIFNNLDELVNLEVVKEYTSQSGFYRLSLQDKGTLFAEMNNGKTAHLIGYLIGKVNQVEKLGLPVRRDHSFLNLPQNINRFQIRENSQSHLFEIFDNKKQRKVGACLKEADVNEIISGYIKGDALS